MHPGKVPSPRRVSPGMACRGGKEPTLTMSVQAMRNGRKG